MAIRLVVLDDNPHVTWDGRVHPVNATFHRFLAAVLDRPEVASIVHVVPLRTASAPPMTLAVDARIRVLGTAPFDGIAGFMRHGPGITRRNAGPIRAALRDADLLWLKVPASNALLAAGLARAAGVPRFVWVAGRASDVVASQSRGLAADLAARATAAAYDGIGRVVGIGGDRVVVGEGLADGDGLVTSVVEPADLRPVPTDWPAGPGLRLAWAGRLVAGKGLEAVLHALPRLAQPATLDVLGDGPARVELERQVPASHRDAVRFHGHVADRAAYLDRLAAADVFVFPSPAEGFPKVVLDAMAVGRPVVASPSGALREAVAAGLVAPVLAGDPAAVARTLVDLHADPPRALRLARAGHAFAARHTAPAEAARLVDRWRARWPELPWG